MNGLKSAQTVLAAPQDLRAALYSYYLATMTLFAGTRMTIGTASSVFCTRRLCFMPLFMSEDDITL